jgi:uncharacterized protein YjbI with pentapeptide repeats
MQNPVPPAAKGFLDFIFNNAHLLINLSGCIFDEAALTGTVLDHGNACSALFRGAKVAYLSTLSWLMLIFREL